MHSECTKDCVFHIWPYDGSFEVNHVAEFVILVNIYRLSIVLLRKLALLMKLNRPNNINVACSERLI